MKSINLVNLFYKAAQEKGAETTTTVKRGELSISRKAAPKDESAAALVDTLDQTDASVSHTYKTDAGEDAGKVSVKVKKMDALRRRVLVLGLLKLPIPAALLAELAALEGETTETTEPAPTENADPAPSDGATETNRVAGKVPTPSTNGKRK